MGRVFAALLLATSVHWLGSAAAAEAPTKPAVTTLPSITVTATQSPVQTLVDRKVYSVNTDLQGSSGTAADVLNQVPSVDVDLDGNVSLRGSGNVTILIDGKPSAQLSGGQAGDGLLQLPANDIDKVEVMTNPPVQFKADGTGVINIILKKNRKPGASGTLQASAGNYRRYVLGASGSYNSGAFTLSGGLNLRQDNRTQALNSTLVATDAITNAVVTSCEDLYTYTHRLLPSFRGSIGYRPNERQSVLFSFTDRQRSGHGVTDQVDQSNAANSSLLTASARHGDGQESGHDSDQTLHFTQVLRRPEETLDLNAHHSISRSRQFLPFLTSHGLPVQPPDYEDLSFFMHLVGTGFSADYALALPKGRALKLGYDYQSDDNAFDNGGNTIDPVSGLPVLNPNVTNFFRYHQQVHSAYASYQISVAQWTLLGGARLERTSIDTRQVIGDIIGSQKYTRVYPSLHVARILSRDSTLNLVISRRVVRPWAELLNPFVDRQVTHNLRGGNPDLKPQDTRVFELSYNVDSNTLQYAVTAYLRREHDSFTEVTRLVSDDVVLNTRENLPRSQAQGLEFNANGHITADLSFGISGNLFHNELGASTLGSSGLQTTTGLNGKISLDYRATAVDMAQLSFTRYDKRLTPQGYVTGSNMVNIGYKRQLTRDLSVIATIADLFNGQHFTRVSNAPLLTNTFRREIAGRIAFLGVIYQLGAATKNKPTDFEYEQ